MTYEGYTEFKNWHATEFGLFTEDDAHYYQHEIAPFFFDIERASFTMLEVGFGNGSLLGWARSQGVKVYGTEIQDELKNRALDAGFLVIDDLKSVEKNSVDLCVALDIFEHVDFDDLIDLCRDIRSTLRPDGYLIARFPNGDSPFSMVNQNADPTHKQHIGRIKAETIMQRSGMRMVALRAQADVSRSLSERIKLSIKKLLRSIYLNYAKAAFLGGSTPSTFEVNYVLIAKK